MSNSEAAASSASSAKVDLAENNIALGTTISKSLSSLNGKGLRVQWSSPGTPSSSSQPGFDVVIVHGLYGSASNDIAQNSTNTNPGSGSSSWVQEYIESLSELDCRLLLFGYDANPIVTEVENRVEIERLSAHLLNEFAKLRQNEVQKRAIMFVAYDIGCTIVKDALVTSLARPSSSSESEIFDYTRMLVFSGCPHRSEDEADMQDKISQFLFTTHNQYNTAVKPLLSSVKWLADTIIEINGLFIDSKVYLRSHLISIIANESKDGLVNHVFDSYTGALGVPFEKQLPESLLQTEQPVGLLKYLEQLKDCRS